MENKLTRARKNFYYCSAYTLLHLQKFFLIYFIIVLRAHCDFYKSSYNRSQLNSASPSFSFWKKIPEFGIINLLSFIFILIFK